jgi:PadR family transcriptional regulator
MTIKGSRKLIQGTLDMLILKALWHGTMHGYGVARRIEQLADDALVVEEGSLYPALYRIEQQGWIKSEWDISENNQRAKYYTLTKAGRKQLEAEEADWDRLSSAISRVLRHV